MTVQCAGARAGRREPRARRLRDVGERSETGVSGRCATASRPLQAYASRLYPFDALLALEPVPDSLDPALALLLSVTLLLPVVLPLPPVLVVVPPLPELPLPPPLALALEVVVPPPLPVPLPP